MAHPTKKTPEVVAEVLARLAQGEMLAPILKSDKKFPHYTAWEDWMRADQSLALAYVRARKEGYDCIAREALAIADNANADAHIAVDAHGKQYVKMDGEMVARSKLRVETRLKLLAKWNPEKYGESSVLNIANKDGEAFRVQNTNEVNNAVVKVGVLLRARGRLTDDERAALPPPTDDNGEDLV